MSTNQHRHEIHDEGYQAYYDGVEKSGNPYPADSTNAIIWLEGWNEAEEEG